MFKKTQPTQGDLFKSISHQVSGRKSKILEDPASWHNVFYDQVTRQIDEDVFSVLYHKGNGRPNASIRKMVAMMILKEGNGWSDQQLFEQCRFNLTVMRALGIQNLDEDVPVESTWYRFRKEILEYYEAAQDDLMKRCFQRLTAEQIMMHGISGAKVRMDSKLINSNIANHNRIELILEVVRSFVKPLDLTPLKGKLDKEALEFLQSLKEKTVANITYALSNAQQGKLLVSLGHMIQQLLTVYRGKEVDQYDLLERLWTEQYTTETAGEDDDDQSGSESGIQPRDPSELSATSIQSAHDSEAGFRKKGQDKTRKTVKGYHGNIIETCTPENEINLIVDVDVREANVSECEFLLPGLEASEEVFGQAYASDTTADNPKRHIEHVTTDGGYDSYENRIALTQNDAPHWNLSNVRGRKSVITFGHDEQGQLIAYHTETGEQYKMTFSSKCKKHIVHINDKFKRYYTETQIEQVFLRQQLLADRPPEDRSIRANVEASIHQVFHRLGKNEKVRYRGRYQSHCYVLYRAMWTNFRRIQKKTAENSPVFDFWGLWRSVRAQILNWFDGQGMFNDHKIYAQRLA